MAAMSVLSTIKNAFKTINIAYTLTGKVWLDTITPYHFS